MLRLFTPIDSEHRPPREDAPGAPRRLNRTAIIAAAVAAGDIPLVLDQSAPPLVVGRTADFALLTDVVSRRHLELRSPPVCAPAGGSVGSSNGGGAVVRLPLAVDLGGINGSAINGRHLTPNEPVPLFHGDVLELAPRPFLRRPAQNPLRYRVELPPALAAVVRPADPPPAVALAPGTALAATGKRKRDSPSGTATTTVYSGPSSSAEPAVHQALDVVSAGPPALTVFEFDQPAATVGPSAYTPGATAAAAASASSSKAAGVCCMEAFERAGLIDGETAAGLRRLLAHRLANEATGGTRTAAEPGSDSDSVVVLGPVVKRSRSDQQYGRYEAADVTFCEDLSDTHRPPSRSSTFASQSGTPQGEVVLIDEEAYAVGPPPQLPEKKNEPQQPDLSNDRGGTQTEAFATAKKCIHNWIARCKATATTRPSSSSSSSHGTCPVCRERVRRPPTAQRVLQGMLDDLLPTLGLLPSDLKDRADREDAWRAHLAAPPDATAASAGHRRRGPMERFVVRRVPRGGADNPPAGRPP
ncbi:hypothetical protein HK405_014499, partial [Cladochytrium tenue]